jgi:SSS family solute:Na+ symporter
MAAATGPATLGVLDWVVIGGYLAAMIALGALLASRIRQFKDYFLAGGALTTPLLVCTLVSTYYELDVTLATSESAYHYGMVAWVWLSRPYYIAIILAAVLLAGRLKKHRAMTLPDILEHYYGAPTRIVGAMACFIYSLPITAIAGMSVLFETLGWPREAGLTVTIGICVAYTIMGGLWADAVSDTIQFVLMCVSVAVAIPIAVEWIGGFDFTGDLPGEHLTATGGLSAALIVAWTVGALTVFVEPAFYQRIFAAKSARSVRNALLIGIVLWAAYDWGVTLIGMIARAAVERGLLEADLEGKAALLTICMQSLPLGLRGLFLGGVLAAAMSSVDSYALLAAGNIVYDLYRPLRRSPLPDRALIVLTRGGVFIVMLLAVGASLLFDRITDAWVFVSSVLVSVVFVPLMAGLFLPRPPRPAAGLFSAVAGLATLIAFYTLVYLNGAADEDAESVVWRLGGLEIWREYAVLAALPMSALGFLLGPFAGQPRREPGP